MTNFIFLLTILQKCLDLFYMNKRTLIELTLPFMELTHLLITSLVEWLEKQSRYVGSQEEYEAARARIRNYRRRRRHFF